MGIYIWPRVLDLRTANSTIDMPVPMLVVLFVLYEDVDSAVAKPYFTTSNSFYSRTIVLYLFCNVAL